MDKEKITLAIPVFNASSFILRALESAYFQTYDNYEILIIDNASVDDTLKIIESFQDSHKERNIRIIRHPQNMGLGASKNTAIEKADGKYLFFMDADDVIYPYTLEKLYSAAKEHEGTQMVVGSIRRENVQREFLFNELCNNEYCEGQYAAISSNNFFYQPTWNKLYLISFLRENNIRCIPHHLHEDLWFSFQMACVATKVVFIKDITYIYIYNSLSICSSSKGNISVKMANEMVEICEHEYHSIKNDIRYNNYRFENMYVGLLVGTAMEILVSPQITQKKQYINKLKLLYIRPSLNAKLAIRLRIFVIGEYVFPFYFNILLYSTIKKILFK